MESVVIIDYGTGNLMSVQRGFQKVGATTTLCSDPNKIRKAGRLVLPGVGAFENGMNSLSSINAIEAIREYVKSGKPLLGICLGMQMFLDSSEENGNHKGLGIIPGKVKPIPIFSSGIKRKIPHIGWNSLLRSKNCQNWKGSCLEDQNTGNYVYFVHSYMAVPSYDSHKLAKCDYNGAEISAAIKKENVTGLQFHPEKSGQIGLDILKSFVKK